jgi:alkylation response protein AidB-like acyl-CoA dehydrogenase
VELEFTAEQEELRDSVRAVLGGECPLSLARSVVEDGVRPDALWKTMVDLGWPALTIPDDHGGIGLGMVEAGIVCEELGRQIAPGPWIPTVTQFAAVVAECGSPAQQADWLGRVAAGEVTGTLAVAEASGSFSPGDAEAAARPSAGTVELSGRKRFVLEGDHVDAIAVTVRADDGSPAVVVVPGGAAQAEPIDAIDQSRSLVDLVLDGVRVESDAVLAAPERLDRALEQATVGLALEMVGTSQQIFDVTLDYAKQREQFGVPIGSFQAVKHKLADMYIALERARATAYFAALTIAEDDERRAVATSVAKAAAGDCQRLMAKEGIQLHGGIGFTWEHDMHLLVKRLKGTEPLFGNAAWHRQRIADLLGI